MPNSNQPNDLKRFDEFSQSLMAKFPKKSLCSDSEIPFLFANDRELGLRKNSTNYYASLSTHYDQNAIGIIIGNGHIHSLLDKINANTILMCDIDIRVHQFIQKVTQILFKYEQHLEQGQQVINFAQIATDIKKEIIEQSRLINKESDDSGIYNDIDREMKFLGDMHFLSSENRFRECLQALKTKELIFVTINLFDQKSLNSLTGTINQHEKVVTFMNLTNVEDYDSGATLYKHLHKFPIGKNFKGIATCLNAIREREQCDSPPRFRKGICAPSIKDLKQFILNTNYRGALTNTPCYAPHEEPKTKEEAQNTQGPTFLTETIQELFQNKEVDTEVVNTITTCIQSYTPQQQAKRAEGTKNSTENITERKEKPTPSGLRY